jgi:hypothetical protein
MCECLTIIRNYEFFQSQIILYQKIDKDIDGKHEP